MLVPLKFFEGEQYPLPVPGRIGPYPFQVLPIQLFRTTFGHIRSYSLPIVDPPFYCAKDTGNSGKVQKNYRVASRETNIHSAAIIAIYDPGLASHQFPNDLAPLVFRCFNPAGFPVESVEMGDPKAESLSQLNGKG